MRQKTSSNSRPKSQAASIPIAAVIAIFSLLIVLLILTVYLLVHFYIKNQPIVFEASKKSTAQQLMKKNSFTIQKQKVGITLDQNQLDQYLNSLFEDWKTSHPESSAVTKFYYDLGKEKLYLEVNTSNDKRFTFAMDSQLTCDQEGITLSLKQIRLGSLRMPYSYLSFQMLTGILEQELVFPNRTEGVIRLEAMEWEDGIPKLTFGYSEDNLLKLFKEYQKQADLAQVKMHKKNKDMDALLLKISDQKSIDNKYVSQCMDYFEKNPDGLTAFSYLLEESALESVTKNLGSLFQPELELKERIALAEEDKSAGLSSYHNEFLTCFYAYLYDHGNYQLTDSAFTVDQKTPSYQKIFSESGYENPVYPIDFSVKSGKVYAVYQVNDQQIDKLILSRK